MHDGGPSHVVEYRLGTRVVCQLPERVVDEARKRVGSWSLWSLNKRFPAQGRRFPLDTEVMFPDQAANPDARETGVGSVSLLDIVSRNSDPPQDFVRNCQGRSILDRRRHPAGPLRIMAGFSQDFARVSLDLRNPAFK
jgi:hypothetical protein